MSRIRIQPVLVLLAAAALTGPLAAQKENQEPPKKQVPVESAKEAPTAEAREIAKKAAHFESIHRDRIARMDRLISIYTAKGDRAKVAQLQALREKQMKRHDNAMEGFRKQLGPDSWGRLEKEMKGPSARARQVRDEHANQNEREREARKAAKEGQPGGKPEKPPEKPKDDAHDKERSKEKPPGRPGGKD